MGIFLGKNHSIFLIWILTFCSTGFAVAEQPHLPFQVIVNPSNPITSVDQKFLAQAFLKKAVLWPNSDSDQEVIQPVDLAPESPTRHQFSERVLSRSVTGVKNYWQQAIFSGRDVPPPELPSDEEVINYVVSHEGSIGYVSNQAKTHDVKVVTIK